MRIQDIKEEDKKDRVVDLNCTFCLDCIESCPEKALSLSLASKPFYRGGKDWWKRRGKEPEIDMGPEVKSGVEDE